MRTVLATTQTVAINVAYLSSGMRVPGCQGDDDSVGKEADRGNERCLPQFGMIAPRNEDNDDSIGKEADRSNGCCISSGMKVSGCQDNVDSVGNDADNGNECCLPWFWYEGPWLPGR